MQIIFRFGKIGDLITAKSAAINLGLRLYASHSFITFIFSKKIDKRLFLEEKLSFKYITLSELRQEIKTNSINKIYLLSQSNSLTFKIKARFIQYILNTEVILFFQGNQWIYKSLSSSYLNVKNFIQKKTIKKIAICWQGSESFKGLNSVTVLKIIEILNKYSNTVELTILGESNLSLPNLTNLRNLSGNTTINELFSEIENSDLVISVDSGPLHYAHYLDKYIISFSSLHEPLGTWYPFGNKVAVVTDIFSTCVLNNCRNSASGSAQCINGIKALENFNQLFNEIH